MSTRAHSLDELTRVLDRAGVDIDAWYGVRIFTDHLVDEPPGPDFPVVLEVEWQAGRRDPYRRVARLIHLVGRRR